MADHIPENSWKPRPWNAELSGCLWLPRMLDKGRRALESERQGRDLMNGYLFGDYNFTDRQLLRFLRTNDRRVRELLCESDDDPFVAEALVRESGRVPEAIRVWNRRFRLINAPIIPLYEVDEGQRKPSLWLVPYKFLYDRIVLPLVYVVFSFAERRRRSRERRAAHQSAGK